MLGTFQWSRQGRGQCADAPAHGGPADTTQEATAAIYCKEAGIRALISITMQALLLPLTHTTSTNRAKRTTTEL